MSFMPPYASKQRAVIFIKKELQAEINTHHMMFLGLGDSISDCGFMSECDFQIIPSESQIAGTFV